MGGGGSGEGIIHERPFECRQMPGSVPAVSLLHYAHLLKISPATASSCHPPVMCLLRSHPPVVWEVVEHLHGEDEAVPPLLGTPGATAGLSVKGVKGVKGVTGGRYKGQGLKVCRTQG